MCSFTQNHWSTPWVSNESFHLDVSPGENWKWWPVQIGVMLSSITKSYCYTISCLQGKVLGGRLWRTLSIEIVSSKHRLFLPSCHIPAASVTLTCPGLAHKYSQAPLKTSLCPGKTTALKPIALNVDVWIAGMHMYRSNMCLEKEKFGW